MRDFVDIDADVLDRVDCLSTGGAKLAILARNAMQEAPLGMGSTAVTLPLLVLLPHAAPFGRLRVSCVLPTKHLTRNY